MPTYLTPQEIADALKISLKQFFRLVVQGRLPYGYRFGSVLRYRQDEVLEYLDRRRPLSVV